MEKQSGFGMYVQCITERNCSEVMLKAFCWFSRTVSRRSNDDSLHVKGVRVAKGGSVFLEGEGWRHDRGGRGRGGGRGGPSRGPTGPSGREASVGWTCRPREVLLDRGRGDRRLFVLL